MFEIKKFEKEDVPDVIAFERELRRQEPDTYYWEPDETYAGNLERCFDDPLFNTAMSFIALKNGCVIGRIMYKLTDGVISTLDELEYDHIRIELASGETELLNLYGL